MQDIIYDSRKAAPGLAFVCIVGTQRDSHEFAADCAAKGVSVLVIQHDIDLSAMPGVTVVKVESSRYAMALMSGNLFGNPSRQMTMIGVTGTKGKTTTTHMIKSVLEAAGKKVGMIGTNGIYFMGRHQETANTTPESYELQKTFRQFLDAGCDVALMEVSSQGLMMDRVAGVHYDIGVFTNLSPDHIGPGEHKTFEEYRSWKGQLFRRCDVGRGFRVPLIPADEHADAAEFGVERLIAQVAGGEVEFFLKAWILRNMHLAVHAQERTVRIHHPGGIMVKPGGTLFKAGGNNHHAQFRRQFPVGFRQFPGNRFRQVE